MHLLQEKTAVARMYGTLFLSRPIFLPHKKNVEIVVRIEYMVYTIFIQFFAFFSIIIVFSSIQVLETAAPHMESKHLTKQLTVCLYLFPRSSQVVAIVDVVAAVFFLCHCPIML